MPAPSKCPVCGTEMIQKSPPRLLATGIAFIVIAALAELYRVLRIPAAVAALTGIYLLVWATTGKARWCRECKTFRIQQ